MEEFNEDELTHPAWMDLPFFQTVLISYEKDDSIEIKDLKITPGSGKGDHYASIMFRVVAEYTSSKSYKNSKSMIIKTIPDVDGFKKKMFENSPIFKTEIGMYSEVIPKFESILRKHGDNTQFCPRLIYHSLNPNPVIILEDLVPAGYSCLRDRFLTIDEAKACYSKLAKWHAISYKLGMEGDESITKYQNGILSELSGELPTMLTGGMQRTINAISKVEGLQSYAEKFQAIEPTLLSKCNEIFNAYRKHHKAILVLNHGDFHGRNVMFKFDKDGNYEDVMLIDFQISCYAPSVIDLTYSTFMLLSKEQRKNNRVEFVYYYLATFLETLKKIGFAGDMPSFGDLCSEMQRYKEIELWIISTFLPLVHGLGLQSESTVDTETLFSSTDALSMMYMNPSFIEELKTLLPKLLHKGFLE